MAHAKYNLENMKKKYFEPKNEKEMSYLRPETVCRCLN